MSGHGISNGEAMRFFETDGRKSASVQESSVYDIAKEKAFSKIRLRDNEIADTRSGFSVFNRKTVKLAKARLRATGVMDAYAIWRHEEGFRQSNGGAPALISVENLLIGWMLVTTAGQPQLILQIGSVFYGMLTDGAREEPRPAQAEQQEVAHEGRELAAKRRQRPPPLHLNRRPSPRRRPLHGEDSRGERRNHGEPR